MLNGLKDRLLNISSSAKRITVSTLNTAKNSFFKFCSATASRVKGLTSSAKRKIVISTASVVVLTTAVCIGVSMINTVTIVDGDAEKTVITFQRYVDDVLKAEGITLGENDKMNVVADAGIEDNMRIEIKRAHKFRVTEKGVTKEHMAVGTTAGEVLNELGYDVKETDKITPAFNESVKGVENITLVRTNERIIEINEPIPYDTTERSNSTLAVGKTKVIQEGRPGEKNTAYRVRYEDGVEVSREKLGERVVTESIEKITEIGTQRANASAPVILATTGTVQTSRSGDLAYSRVLSINATAYDASSCGKSPSHPGYGITATGARATYGVVAVDPRVIPLGSRLYIESADGSYVYGNAIAADTGGAIKGNRIDLCFNTRQEAINFGRRQVKVYILN